MKVKNLTNKLFIVIILISCQSCKKDWLDAKPDKAVGVPGSIRDFQALLDNTAQTFNNSQASGLAEIASGDFYILYSSWQSLFSSQEKSAYIWEENSKFYSGESSIDWVNSYRRVLNSNVILEGIEKVKPTDNEQQEWNNVKGSALFFRSFDLYNLAQEYCKSYMPSSAKADLGLPLRLEYDVNIKVKRSNLQQTYNQVIGDLKFAIRLLGSAPLFKTRPSKQAAYALLARTYLSMEAYDQAGLYADSALQIQSDLLNYATITTLGNYPMARFNTEVIFQSIFSYGIFNASRLIVEPDLYIAYNVEDCRRFLFFTSIGNGRITFRGSYNGDKNLFGGLATDELYLIRAESYVRAGNTAMALKDLNLLLKNRWRGVYQDLVSTDLNVVLTEIIKERRKELIFRGLRWSDLRRLNRDYRFAVTLTRVLDDQIYTLLPNDKRYVFPIDDLELGLSGIQQNER